MLSNLKAVVTTVLFMDSYAHPFIHQIIVRPATVFGYEDRFLNWIGEASCRMPFFPLINEGSPLVQPIYAPDLGKAIMHIIQVSPSPFLPSLSKYCTRLNLLRFIQQYPNRDTKNSQEGRFNLRDLQNTLIKK